MNFLTLYGLSSAAQTAAIGGALGALGVLIAMYFLKLKRIRCEISSTFLWQKSVRDMRANSPFQRLRRNLLLFLQLLILLAALLALGRPAMLATASESATYIVLIDTSASMSSTDVSPNRLAHAVASAGQVVDDMTPRDSMMLIAFGSHPRVVQTLTDDKEALRVALRTIEASDTATNLSEPLELAGSLALGLSDPHVIVISDGGFANEPLPEDFGAPLEFVGVGKAAHNVGITAMDIRRSIENPAAGEIFVRINNFASEAVKTTTSLYIDDTLADAGEIEIEPGSSQAYVFKVALATERVARVSLDVDDDLVSDNSAWAILEPPPDVEVTVVGSANPFLLKALNASGRFQVQRASSEVITPSYEGTLPVFVYDCEAPLSLGRAGYLIFNAVAPAEGFKEEGTLANPVILDVDTASPIAAFLDLGDIFIEKARKMTFPPETRVLVNADEAALVALSYVGDARVITVAFDPMDSRWPLRISYPMFVTNAVNFLASGGPAQTARRFSAGDVLVLDGRPGISEILVTTPDGSISTLQSDGGSSVAFGRTGRAGVYTATIAGREIPYAANLTDIRESDITPVNRLEAGSASIAATDAPTRKNREIWRELLLFAFVVLMVEWYIYNRRTYV